MIRIIGDIHSDRTRYLKLVSECDYSLQLGDLDFGYSWLKEVDPKRHKILPGNHDNYEFKDSKFIKHTAHFIGDFGFTAIDDFEFFYIRGGRSIDQHRRLNGFTYFDREELSVAEFDKCIDLYTSTKPDIVCSHECPSSICNLIGGPLIFEGSVVTPSSTAKALQAMLDIHRPKIWYFGHHHRNWIYDEDGTSFRCVDRHAYLDHGKADKNKSRIVDNNK